MTMSGHNEYGTFYIESEAVMAMGENDHEYARMVVAQMTTGERRAFRRQLFHLYWFVGQGLTRVEDIEEMMGELMMIANDTAPNFP